MMLCIHCAEVLELEANADATNSRASPDEEKTNCMIKYNIDAWMNLAGRTSYSNQVMTTIRKTPRDAARTKQNM